MWELPERGDERGEWHRHAQACNLVAISRAACRSCQNVTTSVLSGTLSTELIRTIRNKLPSLTANLQSNITTLNKARRCSCSDSSVQG